MDYNQGTITRRLESVRENLGEEFGAFCTQFEMNKKLDKLNRSRGTSVYSENLGNLMDLLDVLKIDFDDSREDYDYYDKLVRNIEFPELTDLEEKMIYKLYKIYEEYPLPEEYMLRIVNRLSKPEDNWQDDTLRLRILKQFIKYGNYLYDAEAGGKGFIKKYVKAKIGKISSKNELEDILDNVDDAIFDVLSGGTKDQKEFSGTYGLLKICDDLASGQFRMGGATKKNLYLFAICYGMTFYIGKDGDSQIIDYKTDIEKNLFRDYYVNNLMRFLTNSYKENRNSFEKEPNGLGINYKNFAEMIYIYYLAKPDSEMSPAEKIKCATEMINRIKDKAYKSGLEKKNPATLYLKDMFCDDILMKSSEDFEEYITTYYDCDTYIVYNGKSGNKVSEMQVSTGQNTAFECFKELIEEIEDEVSVEDISYVSWIEDLKIDAYEKYKAKYPDIDKEKFEEFLALIFEMDRTVDIKEKIEEINTSKEVSRTAIVVASYHLFNLRREDDDTRSIATFTEIFDEFASEANVVLNNCAYQQLNCKNIFDVLIVFSIYVSQYVD